MCFKIPKNKKLSGIITRGCIFFALLIVMLYPACAGGLDSSPQMAPMNPELPDSPENSGNSTSDYNDTGGDKEAINLTLQTTPTDPEFQDYIEHPEDWESTQYDEDRNLITLGITPSPISVYWPDNYSYSSDSESEPDNYHLVSGTESAGEYPTELYFSLVDEGRVTSVKDQGSAGSCGPHATLASLESYLIPVDSRQWDFSENNMKNLLSENYSEGFDRAHDSGAGASQLTAYLTRWSGPVLESDDPYNPTSGVSPTNKTVQKHVQQVLNLPPRNNATDNGLIKKMIKEKAGVWAAFDVDWSRFGSKDGYSYVTFYNSAIASSGANGHAICIVGWDDNFSRNNFTSTPPGDGAFICKNSWGTGNGINGSGYFYISYYDANLGTKGSIWPDLFVYTAASPNNYENVSQYDPLGWTAGYGYNNLTHAWAANVFTAESDEDLKATGFYTPTPDTSYEVYIYRDPFPLPVNGTPIFNTSGSFELPGYHTVPIEQSIPLSAGQKFSIVVNISSKSDIKFPTEYNYANYSSKVRANPGESYINSSGTSWKDLTDYSSTSNFCIKAYTTEIPVIQSVSLNTSAHGNKPKTGDLIKVSVNATDNIAVTSVEASGSSLVHQNGDVWEGTITAIAGTHSVNVSAKDAAGNVAWNNSTSYEATTPDTEIPVVKLVSLNTSTPSTGDFIKVSVNATDNVAVTSVEASGSSLVHQNGDIWEGTITALAGTHSVNVSAKDNAGNIAWNNSTSYTATTADTEVPVIQSVNLNTSTPNTGDFIKVSVNATDNAAVISVEASGSLLSHLSGDIWEGTITALEGIHSVNVSAKDDAGNVAWNNSTVYTATTADIEVPVIQTVSLNTSAPNTGDLIRMNVSATDNVAVTSIEASGSPLTHLSGDLWEGTITAIAGTHSVNLSAKDNAENVAWDNSTSYTATTPDTEKPVIQSVILNSTTPETGDFIRVNVSATDNVEVTSVETSGSPLTHSNGDLWEGTITAIAGTHSVNVSAKDNAENVAWDNSTSYTANAHSPGPTEDTEPPEIHPFNSYPVNTTRSSSIYVTVNVTDNIEVANVTVNGILLTKNEDVWEGSIKAPSRIGNYNIPVVALDASGNKAESSLPCHVLKLKGMVSFNVNPTLNYVKKGTTVPFKIKIKNNQNVDETFKVRVGNTMFPASRRENFSGFSWTEKVLNLRAGEEVTLPLEVKVQSNVTGLKVFQVRVDSTLSPIRKASRGYLVVY